MCSHFVSETFDYNKFASCTTGNFTPHLTFRRKTIVCLKCDLHLAATAATVAAATAAVATAATAVAAAAATAAVATAATAATAATTATAAVAAMAVAEQRQQQQLCHHLTTTITSCDHEARSSDRSMVLTRVRRVRARTR